LLIILENFGKLVIEGLPILVTKLRNLKSSFTLSLQNDKFLYSKILIACCGVFAYAIALIGPLVSISNLISKLYFAIIIYKAKYLLENKTFFTNR
jgi:hypothetical protein